MKCSSSSVFIATIMALISAGCTTTSPRIPIDHASGKSSPPRGIDQNETKSRFQSKADLKKSSLSEAVSWREARSHLDTIAKVYGKVVTVAHLLGNRTVINLGGTPDEGGFIVVITDSTMLPKTVMNGYYGKTISVTGKVFQEGSNVGMFVSDPEQIEITK